MAFFGFKNLSSLSDVDMTIYRYVTQNVNEVVYMRVRDIATNANVSSSSVMRFIHKIGFNRFPEFKAYLKNTNLHTDTSSLSFKFVDENSFPKDIESRLIVVANEIYQSDNVTTLGMGESGFLAEYAARRLASLGINTTPVSDPFYPLSSKLKNTTNDILLCFSVSGNSVELIELINDFVNNEDVTIICITSDEKSSIAKMSRYVLPYYEETHRLVNGNDLSSQVPVMYIIEKIDSILESMLSN
ncbi:MurR/RpiR family transcriptional regulator [Lactobacillus corticis]|uniref:RpiR family transcriptional regulator n=1 Tax=Lactobacillus corticis TaxID=2201249 RepID=A0A916VI87_9LACO|nr:MurR/RpiR family transcriptional regulator [Lactobacillus corticis]GFZ27512.1 RpiR family transcriptional regulator [Lactobacillus corticis]